MLELTPLEEFLLKLERNERDVFNRYPEHILIPIIPFFQLVHVVNIELVLTLLSHFEQGESNILIRLDGFLTLAADETSIRNEDFRRWILHLLESMRY